MYKELKKFKVTKSFTFGQEDSLEEVCNAPESASGIFLVHAIEGEEKELIMVGSTGTIQNDGTLKSKNGGLYDKIVNGHLHLSNKKSANMALFIYIYNSGN